MPWGRLDDGLYDHPKLDALGRDRMACVGLWTVCISWCNRRMTDGLVPADRVVMLGGTRALAERLADAGMFERVDGGYRVHDFLDYNDESATVRSRRDSAAERQRRKRGVTPKSQRDSQPDDDVTHAQDGRDDPRDEAGLSRPDDPVSHEGPEASVTAESQRVFLAGARPQDRPRPGPARPVPSTKRGLTSLSSTQGARAERRVHPSSREGVEL